MIEIKLSREPESANAIIQAIRNIDNGIELAPVVRCKDCKYYRRGITVCRITKVIWKPDDFCSYGERKYGKE